MLLVPHARTAMQRVSMFRFAERKLVAQQLTEEMVVAVPLALRVERDQEEVRTFQLVEDRHRARPVGDCVAERRAEASEDRRLEQEAPRVLGKAGQHL